MKKSLLSSMLVAFTIVLGLSGVACKENEPTESVQEVKVRLSETQLNMTLGTTQVLRAHYNVSENASLQWYSDNEAVVSVDNGVIVANDIGAANISVSYGEDKAECEINVGFGDYVPLLDFNNIADSSQTIYLSKSESLNLNATVSFNGLSFNDAEFVYTLADPSMGKIENSIFTPTKTGETTISISTEWKETSFPSLQKTLPIFITENKEVDVKINGNVATDIELDTVDNKEYQFDVAAYENGEPLNDVAVLISGDSVDYNDKTKALSVKKAGISIITIQATLKNGETYAKSIRVNVVRPMKEIPEIFNNFSALDGDFVGVGVSLSDIVEDTIVEAYDEYGNKLSVSENKVKGLQTFSYAKTLTHMIVCDNTYAYKINVIAYTKVIDEANDFAVFDIANAKDYEIDGYYILANNIDANDYVHLTHGMITATLNGVTAERSLYNYFDTRTPIAGFTGTFDGNGYNVDGITVGSYGIFGLTSSCMITNVGFTNVKYANKGSFECLFSGNTGSSILPKPTFKDIYIQVAQASSQSRCGVISSWVFQNTTFENIVIDLSEVEKTWADGDAERTFYSLAAAFPYYKDPSVADIYTSGLYIISKYPLTRLYYTNEYEDAAYVDGVRLDEVYTWAKAKRYTSIEKMFADNNDFSCFSQKCWDIGESGEYAVFRSATEQTSKIAVDKEIVNTGIVELNGTVELAVRTQGVYCVPDSIEVVQGAGVTINGATIKGVGYTREPVLLKVDYRDYMGYVQISVTPKIVESQVVFDNFSAIDGCCVGSDVTLTDVIGTEEVLRAYDAEMNELTIIDGRIYGLQTSKTGITQTEIGILTTGGYYKVAVNGYTLIIDEASDFDYFLSWNDEKTAPVVKNFDGYYILANDIDYNNAHFDQVGKGYSQVMNEIVDASKGGLTGTFDGNGYTISRMKISGAGLFTYIRGGTIKNVAFTDVCIYDYRNVNTLLASGISPIGATIENVYLQIDSMATTYEGSIFYYGYSAGLRMNNIVIEYAEDIVVDVNKVNRGSLFIHSIEGKPVNVQNVYVISSDILNYRNGDASNRDGTIWTGVKRYDTVADWKANKTYGDNIATQNDYSSFTNSGFWSIVEGIPVWDK